MTPVALLPIAVVVPPVVVLPRAVVVPPVVLSPVAVSVPRVAVVMPRRHTARCHRCAARRPADPYRRCVVSPIAIVVPPVTFLPLSVVPPITVIECVVLRQ